MAKPKLKVVDGQDPAPTAPPAYTPTAREQAAFDRWQEKRDARLPLVGMKHEGGTNTNPQLSIDHPDRPTGSTLWMASLGTEDGRVADALTCQLANLAVVNGQMSIDRLNQHLAFVQNLAPENAMEAALATQMAAVHAAMMDMARRLSTATSFQQVDVYERSMNKLARTYTTQAETMKRLRSTGTQRVVVEHKHYHLHQAPEAAGGGAETETEHQSHVRSIPEREAVLRYLEANGEEVPRAGGER